MPDKTVNVQHGRCVVPLERFAKNLYAIQTNKKRTCVPNAIHVYRQKPAMFRCSPPKTPACVMYAKRELNKVISFRGVAPVGKESAVMANTINFHKQIAI